MTRRQAEGAVACERTDRIAFIVDTRVHSLLDTYCLMTPVQQLRLADAVHGTATRQR